MHNVIKVNDELYEIVRVLKVSTVGEDPEKVKAWVDFYLCDRAFKKEERYYLVKDILNVEFEVIENEEVAAIE